MSGAEDYAAQRVAQALASADAALAHEAPAELIEAHAEPWSAFRDRGEDEPEMLVADLWPAGGMGFIASRPKAGKTWLALALALAVSTGRPYLGRFEVPEARDVLYLALEGSRAGIRARIGAMARGMGLNPDGDDLARLHLAYKPAGLDLADPAWARWVVDTAAELEAGLVVVDVLRRAANVREDNGGAQDFAHLLRRLEELLHDGRALVFLHHFGKASDTNTARTAGERMTGSGALHGAYDAALFIVSATEGAREMTCQHDARDIASAPDFGVSMRGTGTATSGGFGYRDRLDLAWLGPPPDPADDLAEQLRIMRAADPSMSKTAAASQLGVGRTSAPFTRAWERVTKPPSVCVQGDAPPAHAPTQAEREMEL